MNPDIQTYIDGFPEEVQQIMLNVRNIIVEEVPEITEKIGYGMPGFYLNGKPFCYFGAFKNHLGFYATPEVHQELKDRLSVYKQGKGSIQFPFKKEIPYALIREMIQLKKALLSQSSFHF